ncbi:MAG: hypothetical protein IJU23_03485 [Proteobacteria bacterium]|nr:hypothetical protein [Pseudomonadota bacterium]
MKLKELWPLCLILTIVGCSEASVKDEECKTGERQCVEQGTKVQICEYGFWGSFETCQPGTLCDNGTKTCKSTAAVCQDNDLLCNGNTLMRCQNGSYVLEKHCDDDPNYICDKTTNSCLLKSAATIVCKESEVKCEGKILYECDGGVDWKQIMYCSPNVDCNAQTKSCVKASADCKDGEIKCDSDLSRVLTCTNGNWKTTEMCEADSECNATTLHCQKGCTEGQSKCNLIENTLMKCTSGTWNVEQNCQQNGMVCNAQNNKCEPKPECVNGERKCATNSDTEMLCSDGHWTSGKTCSANEKCIFGECTKTCSGSDCGTSTCEEGAVCESNVLKVCEGGQSFEKDCDLYQCNATTKSCDAKPECEYGEYRCSSNNLQQCSKEGKWVTSRNCVGNEVCDESQHECIDNSECESGQALCDTNVLKTCGTDGKWKISNTCKSTEKCNASTKTCDLKPVCTSGEYQCNDRELQKCTTAGQWSTDKTCTSSQICSADKKKCLDCSPGTYECDDQTLKQCTASGTWKNTTCTTTQTCSAEKKKCLDCTGSGYQCNGQKLQQCSNNAWKDIKTCSSTEICDSSSGTCVNNSECTNDKFSCQGDTLRKCVNGKWTNQSTCKTTENCNSEKGACVLKPVCEPGAKECSDNDLKTCNTDGQWESSPCGDSAICVAKSDSASCVNKMTLPTWCNIQGVDNKRRGYGRVLIPNDVQIEDISAKFVCGRHYEPVMTWTYSAEAVYNKSCQDCYANTEFMSYSLSTPTGEHSCTFRFDFGPQSFICKQGNSGGEPILLDSTTKINHDDALNLTVPPVSAFTPTWCYFKHYDTEHHIAYGRIWLGDSAVPANVKAKLICGDIHAAASSWTKIENSKENLFCGEDCGNNVEYMVDANSLASGSYSCAFRFDIGKKKYVCPTYRDDYDPTKTGGTPIELTSDKMLNSMNVKNNDDPITVWDVVK